MEEKEIEEIFYKYSDCTADIPLKNSKWKEVDAITKMAFIKAIEFIIEKIEDDTIKKDEIIRCFEPYDKAKRPSFIKWNGFAIINETAFNKFMKEYLIDDGYLYDDDTAVKKANEILLKIRDKVIKEIEEEINRYFK